MIQKNNFCGESVNDANEQLYTLRTAVRKHRDEHGDDRCYQDDYVLYAALPEGYTPPAYDTCVEIHNCLRYIACRQDPKVHYVSPQREIERLMKEVERLKTLAKRIVENDLAENCEEYTLRIDVDKRSRLFQEIDAA